MHAIYIIIGVVLYLQLMRQIVKDYLKEYRYNIDTDGVLFLTFFAAAIIVIPLWPLYLLWCAAAAYISKERSK